MAPSRHDRKNVDSDVKPQLKQTKHLFNKLVLIFNNVGKSRSSLLNHTIVYEPN